MSEQRPHLDKGSASAVRVAIAGPNKEHLLQHLHRHFCQVPEGPVPEEVVWAGPERMQLLGILFGGQDVVLIGVLVHLRVVQLQYLGLGGRRGPHECQELCAEVDGLQAWGRRYGAALVASACSWLRLHAAGGVCMHAVHSPGPYRCHLEVAL